MRTPTRTVVSRPTGATALDEPAWFAAWFDEHFPDSGQPFRLEQIARALGLKYSNGGIAKPIYEALATGRLEGVKLGHRTWVVPRPALRVWLLENNALNLDA